MADYKIPQLTVADPEFLSRLDSDIQEIKRSLRNINVLPRQEQLTSHEFMKRAKIGRWKFDMLISSGKLQYKKLGRKIYINEKEIDRYFAGEMQID